MSKQTTQEEALAQVKSAFGFVPNLMSGIAQHNPAVATAYLGASAALEGGVLTAAEKQVVMLAVSAYNACHYCAAAHRTAAKAMGIPQSELEAIDDRRAPQDARLRALAEAAWTILEARGWLDDAQLDGLSVTRPEVYELVAIVGLKTITNYINHIQHTEVDAPFVAQQKRGLPQTA